MKKIIINENWEEEIIEDNSNFFVLIFKQGSNAGYVKAFSPNNEEILNKYQELVSQYEGTTFKVPTNILIIKLPATGQVKAMLDQALYTGEENNPEQVEILNHLLGRADCEYIGETNLETLEEAKKKKKRKKRKTPRVTYATGWPWYNDHMFNHHMGSCDCNKDKDEAGEDAADNANDAIVGGESVGDAGSAGGDFGGAEGGAMGEGLVLNETMTPLEKMQALNNGTRGFNAKAASTEKLRLNYDICKQHNLKKALKIIEDELERRGCLSTDINFDDIGISPAAIHPTDVFFVLDNADDIGTVVSNNGDLMYEDDAEIIACLLFYLAIALYLKETAAVEVLKALIMDNFNLSSTEVKQLILDKILDNKKVNDRLKECINTALEERNN